ncbi:hypothetical protein NFJ02_21g47220 [Pycnococcus provasolii]
MAPGADSEASAVAETSFVSATDEDLPAETVKDDDDALPVSTGGVPAGFKVYGNPASPDYADHAAAVVEPQLPPTSGHQDSDDDATLRASTAQMAQTQAAAAAAQAIDDDSDDNFDLPTATPTGGGDVPAGFKVYGNPASPDYVENVGSHAPALSPDSAPVDHDDVQAGLVDSDDEGAPPADGPRPALVSEEEAAAKVAVVPVDPEVLVSQNVAEYNAKIGSIFQQLDQNGSGEVNRREFILALRKDSGLAEVLGMPHKVMQEGPSRDAFEAAFNALDDDGSGSISLLELMRQFGEPVQTAAEATATYQLETGENLPMIDAVSHEQAREISQKRSRLDDPTAAQYQPGDMVYMSESAEPSKLARAVTAPAENTNAGEMVEVPIDMEMPAGEMPPPPPPPSGGFMAKLRSFIPSRGGRGGDGGGDKPPPAMPVASEKKATSAAEMFLDVAAQLPPAIALFEVMAALTAFAVAGDCDQKTLKYAAVWAAFALFVHAGALVQVNTLKGIPPLRAPLAIDWLFGRPRWATSPITTAMFLSFTLLFAAGWMLEGLALWGDEDICGKNTSSQAYLGLLSIAYVMLAILLIAHLFSYFYHGADKMQHAIAAISDSVRMHAHRATRLEDAEACVISAEGPSKVLCMNGIEIALLGLCDRTGRPATLPLGAGVMDPAQRSLVLAVMESGRSVPPQGVPASRPSPPPEEAPPPTPPQSPPQWPSDDQV